MLAYQAALIILASGRDGFFASAQNDKEELSLSCQAVQCEKSVLPLSPQSSVLGRRAARRAGDGDCQALGVQVALGGFVQFLAG